MDKEDIENLFSLNPELEKRIKTMLHIEYDKLEPIGYKINNTREYKRILFQAGDKMLFFRIKDGRIDKIQLVEYTKNQLFFSVQMFDGSTNYINTVYRYITIRDFYNKKDNIYAINVWDAYYHNLIKREIIEIKDFNSVGNLGVLLKIEDNRCRIY